jgi:hypothetical protein
MEHLLSLYETFLHSRKKIETGGVDYSQLPSSIKGYFDAAYCKILLNGLLLHAHRANFY